MTIDNSVLRIALHFFDHVIMLTRYDGDGKAAASYPVSLPDVAAALSEVSLNSGVLPPRTVFWQRLSGLPRIGIYVPPRRWQVTVRTGRGEPENMVVPMPPLLWVGHGKRYQLYALRKHPRPGDDPVLCAAPTPNIYPGKQGICAGSVHFPICSAAAIEPALQMFFASEFNTHLSQNKCRSYPNSVLDLWREMHEHKRQRFPMSELVDITLKLSDILAVEAV